MTTRLKTGGRVAGTPNKTTAALKEATNGADGAQWFFACVPFMND